MPTTNTSYADFVTNWRQLLEAAGKTPELKSGIDDERTALEAVIAEVEAIKARQRELRAFAQEATQQLKAAVKRGQDIAIRFRSIARAKVGPYNERMVHFSVAPIRSRKRKLIVEVPTEGEKPGETPGTKPDVPPTT